MTVSLDVRGDMEEITKSLWLLEKKQVPFATVKALTNTAQDAKRLLRKEMQRVFDAPTKFTLNSLYVKPATKNTLATTVAFKDTATKGGTPADKYLAAQIKGGPRRNKRLEAALRKRGLLPGGLYVVPAKGVRLNKNGNITRGTVKKILASLGGGSKTFFVAKRGRAHGVWQRMARNKVRLVLAFVERPQYRRRFNFFGVAGKVSKKYFPKRFSEALAYAIKTAR